MIVSPLRRLVATAVVLSVFAAFGCARRTVPLDDVQAIAYSVKPPVVRVNAYATARFHYTTASVVAIEAALQRAGYDVAARVGTAATDEVATGAGGSGSGFVIHPDGYILTSGHVVAPTRDADALKRDLLRNGAIAALVKHFRVDDLRAVYRRDGLDKYLAMLGDGTLDQIVTVNDVDLSNGEKLPFTVQRYSPALNERGSDLALLHVQRKNLPVLQLGDSEAVRVGDSIWAVGYPAVASSSDEVIGGWLSHDSDLEPTFNPGIITAIKRNVANVPVLQSNVAIYRGNSGGPAVDREGEAVGISTWGHKDAEQIKFLVPIAVARQFLSSAHVALNVEGDFNGEYHAALAEAHDGQWLEARRHLDAAGLIFRNSPDVMRFRNDIDRALRGLPPWRLHPIAFAAGSAAVLLTLVVASVIVARARSRRSAAPAGNGRETLIAPTGQTSGDPSLLGRFTFLNGERAGEKLGLGGSGIRIGRESTICEIVLENPKVSRLHAEVVSIDGKVMLIDRNSSNGTYVNDQKIEKRYLQDGDIIYFGGRNAVAVAFHA
jgi:S1-C subfamily serine protease